MELTDVVPNLIVVDIDRSLTFYRDVLEFSLVTTVPEQAPFAFVRLQRGGVTVFLNAAGSADDDLPELAARPIGGTATLFMTLEADSIDAGIDALFRQIDRRTRVLMPLTDQFYGMREFAIADPDGYVIIFAQRVE